MSEGGRKKGCRSCPIDTPAPSAADQTPEPRWVILTHSHLTTKVGERCQHNNLHFHGSEPGPALAACPLLTLVRRDLTGMCCGPHRSSVHFHVRIQLCIQDESQQIPPCWALVDSDAAANFIYTVTAQAVQMPVWLKSTLDLLEMIVWSLQSPGPMEEETASWKSPSKDTERHCNSVSMQSVTCISC